MAFSTYLSNALANHVFRGDIASTAYGQPEAVYIALHTSDPTADGLTGEVVGGSYSRKLCRVGTPVDGTSSNLDALLYLSMPTCVVTHVSTWDDPVLGNMLTYDAIDAETLSSGDSLRFDAGVLSLGFKSGL